MQLMWTQKQCASPLVRYGLKPDELGLTQLAAFSARIDRDALCGMQQGLPAGTSGYFDAGFLVTAVLLTLEPDTLYFYQLGHMTSRFGNGKMCAASPCQGPASPCTYR